MFITIIAILKSRVYTLSIYYKYRELTLYKYKEQKSRELTTIIDVL